MVERDATRFNFETLALDFGKSQEDCAAAHTEIDRLRGILQSIHVNLSDGNQTFDELIKTVMWCDDRARSALDNTK